MYIQASLYELLCVCVYVCPHRQTGGWVRSLWSSLDCGGCGCVCVPPLQPRPAPSGPLSSWYSVPYLSAPGLESHFDCRLHRDTGEKRAKYKQKGERKVKILLVQQASFNSKSYRTATTNSAINPLLMSAQQGKVVLSYKHGD